MNLRKQKLAQVTLVCLNTQRSITVVLLSDKSHPKNAMWNEEPLLKLTDLRTEAYADPLNSKWYESSPATKPLFLLVSPQESRARPFSYLTGATA